MLGQLTDSGCHHHLRHCICTLYWKYGASRMVTATHTAGTRCVARQQPVEISASYAVFLLCMLFLIALTRVLPLSMPSSSSIIAMLCRQLAPATLESTSVLYCSVCTSD
eukprot:scpid39386/ scgid10268/ 